jgi:hypothetical protein
MELVAQEVSCGASACRSASAKPGFCLGNRVSECKNPVSKAETGLKAGLHRIVTAAFLLVAGCAAPTDLLPGLGDAPPTGPVAQISTAWHDQVVFAPDPVRNGMMAPGLAGRLYLFGPKMGFPLAGDGMAIVDVCDPSQPGPDGAPKMLERWEIKKDTLERCLRKDAIGWGYDLLLPWGTYRPDLTQIVVRARYDPPKGLPIYAQPSKINFNHVLDIQSSSASRTIGAPAQQPSVVPASHQTAPKGT